MLFWKLLSHLVVCFVFLANFTPVTKADIIHRKGNSKPNDARFRESSVSKDGVVQKRSKNVSEIRSRTTNKEAVVESDLCRQVSAKNTSTVSPHCAKQRLRLKRKKRKPLKLRRSRTKETSGVARTLVIVKGNQEVNSDFLKQHNNFRPVLKALSERIKTLKARRQQGKVEGLGPLKSVSHATKVRVPPHATEFPPPRGSAVHKLQSSFNQNNPSQDTLVGKKQEVGNYGETETTEIRTSSEGDRHWDLLGTIHSYEGPRKVFLQQHPKTLVLKENTPLSRLPLYDDRVLKEATSGLRIFVNISKEDKKVQNDNPVESADTTSPEKVKSTDSDDFTSGIPVEDLFSDDETKTSEELNRLLSDDKATDTLAKDIAQLLIDDPSGSSDESTPSTDDLAIVTDDAPATPDNSPTASDTSATTSENTLMISDDSPTMSDDSSTKTDTSTVSADDTATSFQKSSSPTVSSATQQCLARRNGDSTRCSLSMICCPVCCPAASCPVKDILKDDEIPENCNCKRQIVCSGSPHIPLASFPLARPPIVHAHGPTFALRPTSLSWGPLYAGSILPPTQGLVSPLAPSVIPPSHPAVFISPTHHQIPTLIQHPAMSQHIAQPILSPLNINYHWPPHVIPHNPGYPPLFRPPVLHRPHPPYFAHPPIFHHPPMMHHPPIWHPPVHFHPHPHPVPVVIHPPPRPIIIHTPPPPPPPPPPKPPGPPAPSYSGSEGTARQTNNPTVNSPGAPPGLPPLVVADTSKKKSRLPKQNNLG